MLAATIPLHLLGLAIAPTSPQRVAVIFLLVLVLIPRRVRVHRLPAARRRPAVPARHHVPAVRRRPLRADAAGRHQPRPGRRLLGLAELKFVTAAAATGVDRPRAAGRGRRRAARRAGRARGEPPGGAVTPLADGRVGTGCIPHRRCSRAASRLLAILGVVIANLRERLFEFFVPGVPSRVTRSTTSSAAGTSAMRCWRSPSVLIVLVIGFYLSWRMHTFRITEEVVEVRSGILFRTNRKAQARPHPGHQHRAAVLRPTVRRGQAGDQPGRAGRERAAVLPGLGAADELRREILRLASGPATAGLAVPGSRRPGRDSSSGGSRSSSRRNWIRMPRRRSRW